MNESQYLGRMRLRQLRDFTEAAGEEMAEQRQRFQRLAREDSAPRVVSSFNLFQTPEPIADQIAELLSPRGRMLEPSAGLGRLYRAARKRSQAEMVLVEVSPECCGELYRAIEADGQAKLVQSDFLACSAERLGGQFHSILMNPPFKMGTDVKHIMHARSLLAPGGRLVSLCANGPRQRAALQLIASQWIELPPASFKSEGTRVDAAIVVIE